MKKLFDWFDRVTVRELFDWFNSVCAGELEVCFVLVLMALVVFALILFWERK